MAALDFPASPTTGQLFSAANGVTYRWDGTLWLTQAGPGGGTGDFCATLTTGTLPTSLTTLIPTTIVSGNAGLWYSVSTGRWTPPAGRYVIYGSISCISASTTSNINAYLRKNGTNIAPLTGDAISVVSTHSDLYMQFTVDANGSDWFDIQALSGTAAVTINVVTFGAFPLTGMQGPQGPAGPDSKLLQSVSFETGAAATGTTVMVNDDTIPQITEGNEYMTLAITPRSTTSKLIIEVTWFGSSSAAAAAQMVVALFQDSTANALAMGFGLSGGATYPVGVSFRHTMTSGTTSATTFRVRAGLTGAGTTTFNGTAGARTYGGVMASSIMIREEAP